jgi:hypothetical protein
MIHRFTARKRSRSSTAQTVAPNADTLNGDQMENNLAALRIARCDCIHA